MSITKKQVLDYVSETPCNTNRQVLNGLVTELMSSDNLDTSDATATAGDIRTGKTAYVDGEKITGNLVPGVDTSDANAVAGDIRTGKTAYVNGSKVVGTIVSKEAQTYIPSSSEQVINAGQYLAGAQTIAAVPTEEKSAIPSTAEQEVVPTVGKFLSKVTVGGDANLVANNIKNGVSIFGVQGTLTSLDTNDADATAENIDSGKTAYVKGQKITGTSTKVNTADANAAAGDIRTGKTAYVNGVKVNGTLNPGVNTSDANATAEDLLAGKTAYVGGSKITGTAPAKAATTITPTTTDQTVAAGTHLTGILTIKGDPNLLAENIKSGVTIFGIEGTYTGPTA